MGGTIPISAVLPVSTYRKSIKYIRLLSIMFVDQLTSMDGRHLFTSFDINWLLNTNISRASWFLKLESILIFDVSNRTITPFCQPHPSIVDLPPNTVQIIDDNNNNINNPTFIVIWSNQFMTYIVGKVKAILNDEVYIQHYIPTYDANFRADIN